MIGTWTSSYHLAAAPAASQPARHIAREIGGSRRAAPVLDGLPAAGDATDRSDLPARVLGAK